MVAQVIEQIGQSVQSAGQTAEAAQGQVSQNSNDSNVIISRDVDNASSQPSPETEEAQVESAQDLGTEVVLQSKIDNIASQHDAGKAKEKPQQFVRRSHGGALPR
jgi:hypothetical protein